MASGSCALQTLVPGGGYILELAWHQSVHTRPLVYMPNFFEFTTSRGLIGLSA